MSEENKKAVQEPPKGLTLADIYTLPAGLPTIQVGDTGVRYDFNLGCRIHVPFNEKEHYFISIVDHKTGMTVFNAVVDTKDHPNGMSATTNWIYHKQYHIVVKNTATNETLLDHIYDASDKRVLIECPDCGLGDAIGWFSCAIKFQKKWNCKLVFACPKYIADMFRKTYPDVEFIERREAPEKCFTGDNPVYATYYPGLFFDNNPQFQPEDFRQVGIHRHVATMLDVDKADEPPKVDCSAPRQIKEKYVVIASNASSHCKHWNCVGGWYEVVEYLKNLGYRVLCIDKDKFLNRGSGVVDSIPYGCEDYTGDIPLQERINLIKDADFFIGVSSGLSWVAWCCGTPVILISGFTHPCTEFYTPYRVINMDVCHSCWNDIRVQFDHNDPLWCPKYKNTADAYQCTMLLPSSMVKEAIDRCINDLKHKK